MLLVSSMPYKWIQTKTNCKSNEINTQKFFYNPLFSYSIFIILFRCVLRNRWNVKKIQTNVFLQQQQKNVYKLTDMLYEKHAVDDQAPNIWWRRNIEQKKNACNCKREFFLFEKSANSNKQSWTRAIEIEEKSARKKPNHWRFRVFCIEWRTCDGIYIYVCIFFSSIQ